MRLRRAVERTQPRTSLPSMMRVLRTEEELREALVRAADSDLRAATSARARADRYQALLSEVQHESRASHPIGSTEALDSAGPAQGPLAHGRSPCGAAVERSLCTAGENLVG